MSSIEQLSQKIQELDLTNRQTGIMTLDELINQLKEQNNFIINEEANELPENIAVYHQPELMNRIIVNNAIIAGLKEAKNLLV